MSLSRHIRELKHVTSQRRCRGYVDYGLFTFREIVKVKRHEFFSLDFTEITMGFLLYFVFIAVTVIRIDVQDSDDIKFDSSLSTLPPPMDWVCQPAYTNYTDQVKFAPVPNMVTFLDRMPANSSVPEFNLNVIITDQLPHVGTVPETNSSVIITDQLPLVQPASESNSSVIITKQIPHVDSVPEFNSTSNAAGFTMDQYINFSVPVLKLKAASQSFSNGFTSALEIFKLLNFAGLLSFVRLAQVAVAILMVLLLWKQRQESLYLHQEISSAEKATTADLSRLGEMRNRLYSEHIQFTKSENDLTIWDKKMDRVSSKLHDENSNLEEMYKCLVEWKHDWNEQSHKIKQIDTDQFKQIAELPDANVDQLIKEQEQGLGDYLLHAEDQFTHISQSIVDCHDSIMEISAELGSIYDVMNEQSARCF